MTAPPSIRLEAVAAHPAFRRLVSVTAVDHDLRYAGTNNFANRVLYAGLDCGWLRREAASGLEVAAAWLARQRPGWRLLVLDALRPQRVQEAIWCDVAGTPAAVYFADPAPGSIHSFGMAVDVTLTTAEGLECDMGSDYDAMTPASHPEREAEQLALGAITAAQVAERCCLRAAMAAGGFHGIATEWWHYDFGDRDAVRRELPRVE